MAGAKPVYYWDACVWLAWLKDEKRKPGEMEGLYACADLAQRGDAVLVTAAILQVEVLEAKMDATARKKFELIFKRPNIRLLPVDRRIGELAGEIRGYYERLKLTDNKPGLGTPDAIHLAAAIHYNVTEFHTFDQNDKSDCRALLPLNGNVAGRHLVIVKPSAAQAVMNV